mgnify:CR=1 FL=1
MTKLRNIKGLLLDLDTKKMNYKNTKILPLPINKDYRAVLDFDDNQLIFSNNDYIYLFKANSLK